TAVSEETTSLFLESANFDATKIRRSAQRLKKRTESSIRFEKNLDPYQNVVAIQRYLQLLDDSGISYQIPGTIQSVGKTTPSTTIKITHTCIEKKLGITLSSQKVLSILEALEFDVQKQESGSEITYFITVPRFRVLKDIAIQEDIVEEIGRFIGYESIPAV